jgi:hypothetical protein
MGANVDVGLACPKPLFPAKSLFCDLKMQDDA